MKTKLVLVLIGVLTGVAGSLWLLPDADAPPAGTSAQRIETDFSIADDPPIGIESIDEWLAKLRESPDLDNEEFARLLRQELAARPSATTRRTGTTALLWAIADPSAALRFVSQLPDRRTREELTLLVLRTAATQAPEFSLLALISLLDAGFDFGVDGVSLARDLARAAPLAVFRELDALPAIIRSQATAAALRSLARTDPDAAIAYLGLAATTTESSAWTAAIAEGWALFDPAAAISWAQSQPSLPLADVESAIVAIVAETDIDAALELAISQVRNITSYQDSLRRIMGMALANDPAMADAIVDRVLRATDAATQHLAAESLLTVWIGMDGDGAMAWIARNDRLLTEATFRSLLSVAGNLDPVLAANTIDSVPLAVRPDWIGRIATAQARTDVNSALAWLERFRGEPGYAQSIQSIGLGLAGTDPERAIAMVMQTGLAGTEARTVLGFAASQWAQRDTTAAVAWLDGLSDRQLFGELAPQVVSQWAAANAPAARDWALGRPAGSDRDGLLSAWMSGAARNLTPGVEASLAEDSILVAFSDDRARQTAVVNMAYQLSRRNRELARQLIDRYVTDPNQRTQAEVLIAR